MSSSQLILSFSERPIRRYFRNVIRWYSWRMKHQLLPCFRILHSAFLWWWLIGAASSITPNMNRFTERNTVRNLTQIYLLFCAEWTWSSKLLDWCIVMYTIHILNVHCDNVLISRSPKSSETKYSTSGVLVIRISRCISCWWSVNRCFPVLWPCRSLPLCLFRGLLSGVAVDASSNHVEKWPSGKTGE
jgi:hypothetical protein